MRRWNLTAGAIVPALAVLALTGLPPSAQEAAEPAAPEQETAPTVTLDGKVSKPDGTPVAGAIVRILPETPEPEPRAARARRDRVPPPVPNPEVLRTDAQGRFEAGGLEGPSYRLRVEAEGFAPAHRTELTADSTIDITLAPGHALGGTVFDQRTGTGLAGATVRACDEDARAYSREACRTATSGEGGRFRVADLARGVHRVDAVAPAHARRRLPSVGVPPRVDEHTERPLPLNLYLAPGGLVAGRVTATDGTPFERVRVTLVPFDRSFRRNFNASEITDADGNFVFEGVDAPGRYEVAAALEGYASADHGPIEIEPGSEVRNVSLELAAGAQLKFRLVDPDEGPVEGVRIRLVPPESADAPRPRSRRGAFGTGVGMDDLAHDGEGGYTASNLTPGRYTVTLTPDDWEELEREDVRLKEQGSTDLGTLVVRAGSSISGRVADAADGPVADAEISANWRTDRGFQARSTRSDREGRFRLAGLGEETLRRVRVEAEGFAETTRENVDPGDRGVDFTLARRGNIEGRVLLPDGGVPFAFEIEAHSEAGAAEPEQAMARRFTRPDRLVVTDVEGKFSLPVDPGTYTVVATAEGFAPARKPGLVIAEGDTVAAGTLTLTEGLRLAGRVVAARDDSPIPGAAIGAASASAPGFRFGIPGSAEGNTHSAIDGRFELQGLEPGALTITAEHPDYSEGQVRVVLEADAEPPEATVSLTQGGTLTGTVRGSDGQLAAGTRIMVVGRGGGRAAESQSTNTEGRYTFERVPPGTYSVMRIGSGAASLGNLGVKEGVIKEGEVTVVDFGEDERIRLVGRVLRGDEPLPGATLFFIAGNTDGGSMSGFKTTTADESGGYTVGLDAPGEYGVSVAAKGGFSVTSRVDITVPDQPEFEQDIVVRTTRISGTVTGAARAPVFRATVTAQPEGGAAESVRSMSQTDAEGRYALEGLDPGSYRVTVSAAGHTGAERTAVELGEDEQQTLDFQLERGRALRGSVVDPAGRGLAGAMIFVTASGAAQQIYTPPLGESDINGNFEVLAPVTDGLVDVTAAAPGYAPGLARGVAVPDDPDAAPVLLQVTAGGAIRVTVLDAAGAPVPGRQISLEATPAFPGSTIASNMQRPQPTGDDGTTRVGLLAPGTYRVSVGRGEGAPGATVAVNEGQEASAVVTLDP